MHESRKTQIPRCLVLAGAYFWASIAQASSDASALSLPLARALSDRFYPAEVSGVDAEAGLSRSGLLTEAELYRAYRRGQLSPEAQTAWERECASETGRTRAFCPSGAARETALAKGRSPSRSTTDELPEKEIRQALVRGKWSDLESVSEARLHRVLKGDFTPEALGRATDTVLADSGCVPAAALVAVALKHEEALPAERALSRARGLFSRAVECGEDEADAASVAKARFRGALLAWHAGDPAAVERALRPLTLTTARETDYTSRAIYWRALALEKLGDRLRAQALRGRLMNRYPLSVHALHLSGQSGRRPGPYAGRTAWGRDAQVLRRSAVEPQLNVMIAAAETLVAMGESALAADYLGSRLDALERLEPEARLYAAALLQRGGNHLACFRLAGSALRERPELLSRATLRALYPARALALVKSAGGDAVEPWLALSLIRQESGFHPDARSRVGALGLMQLMPETARRMGGAQVVRKGGAPLFNPRINIRLGTRYLGQLIGQFEGDIDLALAAYNAGPEKVNDWLRRYAFARDRMLFLDLIPFAETRNYVSLIARNYFWYRSVYSDWPRPAPRSPASSVLAPEASKERRKSTTTFKRLFDWLRQSAISAAD